MGSDLKRSFMSEGSVESFSVEKEKRKEKIEEHLSYT
jgi:hypothetical protein